MLMSRSMQGLRKNCICFQGANANSANGHSTDIRKSGYLGIACVCLRTTEDINYSSILSILARTFRPCVYCPDQSCHLIAQCRTGGLNDVLSMKEIRQYFRLTRPSANCSSGPGLPESVNTNRRVIFSYSFKVTSTECSLGRNFYFLIKATIYARKLIL